MNSNREELTPDADSSQDDSPVDMPTATRLSRLHIKAKSPKPQETQLQQSAGHTRRSTTNKPLASTCRKRTDSSLEDQIHPGSLRSSSADGDRQPCHKYRRRESGQCQTSQRSPLDVISHPKIRRSSPDVSGPTRHDSLMDPKVRKPISFSVKCPSDHGQGLQ